MAAYVAGARYVYLSTASLTDSKAAGLVAAVFFGANPNVLYMQCTGLSERLLIATVAASVSYPIRWSRSGQYMELAAAGCAGLLASLTRYEGWVYCIEATAVVAYLAWRRPVDAPAPAIAESRIARRERLSLLARYRSMEAHVIYFSLVPLSGIAAWILWTPVIFRDPLYFQTGPVPRPSRGVSQCH